MKDSLTRNGKGVQVSAVSDDRELEIITHDPEQTQRLGERIGQLAQPGDLFCLEGDLGSGKTCFVQGMGRGLGIQDTIHSPTFILANEHREGRLPLAHLDVYRVRHVYEAIGIGLEDYLNGDGVCVIEWAEKIQNALPPERLWILFRHLGDSERKLLFRAVGERYERLLEAFAPGARSIASSPTAASAQADRSSNSQRGVLDASRD